MAACPLLQLQTMKAVRQESTPFKPFRRTRRTVPRGLAGIDPITVVPRSLTASRKPPFLARPTVGVVGAVERTH